MALQRVVRATFALVFGVAALGPSGPASAPDSAEVYKNCHGKTYAQWKGSMHGQAPPCTTRSTAAAIASSWAARTRKDSRIRRAKYPVCLNCHAPTATLDKKTNLTTQVTYGEGVTCVAGHLKTEYHGPEGPGGKLHCGVTIYAFSDGVLQVCSGKNYTPNPTAANDPDPSSHPMPMQDNAMLRTSEACMGCLAEEDPVARPGSSPGSRFDLMLHVYHQTAGHLATEVGGGAAIANL
jgi:hypothetical protein